MKKFLILLIISFSTIQTSHSRDFHLKVGEKISGYFHIDKSRKIKLPEGEYELVEKESDFFNAFHVDAAAFIMRDGNKLIAGFEVFEFTGGGKYTAEIIPILNGIIFNVEKDGCKRRSHYNYFKLLRKGMMHNCFVVKAIDPMVELYEGDNEDQIATSKLRKWISRNDVELPTTLLMSEHSFYSLRARDSWVAVVWYTSPEYFINFQNKFIANDVKDFHPNSITKNKEANKVMKKWIELAVQRHQEFEKTFPTVKKQELDFSDFVKVDYKKPIKKSGNLIKDLEQLNDLYKSGSLSKKEFEKAKKKILD